MGRVQDLQFLLDSIDEGLLPCAYFDCHVTYKDGHDENTDHTFRPVTDLYELGWHNGEDEDPNQYGT